MIEADSPHHLNYYDYYYHTRTVSNVRVWNAGLDPNAEQQSRADATQWFINKIHRLTDMGEVVQKQAAKNN